MTAPEMTQEMAEVAAMRWLLRRKKEGVAAHKKPFGEYLKTCLEPWPYQEEFAKELESGKDIIILKARQIGVTEELTAYARYKVLNGGRVLVLSDGQLYSEDFLTRTRTEELASMEAAKDNSREFRLPGGGRILALPATEHAGRGFTADLVVVDEAAFHPYAEKNYQAYRPTMADGGQLVVVSTANGAGGFFFEQWQAAELKQSGVVPLFYGWRERPGRDEAWYREEVKKWPPNVFPQEYPGSAAEAFVAHAGLVFGADPADGVLIFDPRLNVTAPPFEWGEAKWRVAAVDPGGGDPTAMAAFGISSDEHIHQFGEYSVGGPPDLTRIAEWFFDWHNEAPFDAIEGDPSQGALIEFLRGLGLPAEKANNDRPAGLGAVAHVLKSRRLTISPSCPKTLREYQSYWWKPRAEGRQGGAASTATLCPPEHHGDLMDCTRYVVMKVMRSIERSTVGAVELVTSRWTPRRKRRETLRERMIAKGYRDG